MLDLDAYRLLQTQTCDHKVCVQHQLYQLLNRVDMQWGVPEVPEISCLKSSCQGTLLSQFQKCFASSAPCPPTPEVCKFTAVYASPFATFSTIPFYHQNCSSPMSVCLCLMYEGMKRMTCMCSDPESTGFNSHDLHISLTCGKSSNDFRGRV